MTEIENDEPEFFSKINDHTLSVVIDFNRQSQADPELRRIFNFKSRQITTIYSMWYGAGLTSSMETQNFSALDSLDEVRDMHRKLTELGGTPPALDPEGAIQKPRLQSPRQ